MRSRRWPWTLAAAGLVLLPLLLLWPCITGERAFLPYDLAQFPPASVPLTPAELQAVRDGNNFDATEVPVWFVPELKLARETVVDHGRFPHWNPYARHGTPLLANGHLGLLYPPTWLALLQPDPVDGLPYLAWISFAVAGLLMLGFLRALQLRPWPALLGAMAYAFSGTLAVNAHWYMRLAALAWFPGMLWAALRMAQRRGQGRVPGALGLALTTAMAWLSGFPPYSVAVTLLTALFCLVLIGREHRQEGGAAAARLAVGLLAAALLGLGLAMAHILPQLHFFPESHRQLDPDLAQISQSAFDPAGLLGYLFPDLFGHPTAAGHLPYDRSPLVLWLFERQEWGTGRVLLPQFNFTEYTVFPGTLVLLLAGVGACHRRTGAGPFPVLALLLCLGLAMFVWPLRYLFVLPGVQTVPPLRFAAPACLFVAWLAAVGFERALEGLSRRARRGVLVSAFGIGGLCLLAAWAFGEGDKQVLEKMGLPAAIAEQYASLGEHITTDWVRDEYLRGPPGPENPGGIDYLDEGRRQARGNFLRGALAFSLAGCWFLLLPWLRRRRPLAAGVVVVATAAELLGFAAGVDAGLPRRHSLDTPVHRFLREQRDRHLAEGGITVARVRGAPEDLLPAALPPGTLGPEHIRDLQVYTFFDRRSGEPFKALYGDGFLINGYLVPNLPDDARLQHPLLDLLGLRLLLATAPLQHAGEPVGPQWRGPGGQFFVYERPTALPRAFVVPELRVCDDESAVLAALVEPSFDPRRYACVTREQMRRLAEQPARDPDSARRRVTFLAETGDEVVLEISPGSPGWLVLCDTWLPGWTAYVDEAPTPMLRANAFQRVVPVPAGRRKVRFRYYTPGLGQGLIVSLACIVALMGLALNLAFSRPGRQRAETPM